MGSIGIPELLVVFLMLATVVTVALVVVRLFKGLVAKTAGPAAGLVPCAACGRHISPRAASCPQCGEPRGA